MEERDTSSYTRLEQRTGILYRCNVFDRTEVWDPNANVWQFLATGDADQMARERMQEEVRRECEDLDDHPEFVT